MCTLTYIPLNNNKALVCSNRDEIVERSACELIQTASGLMYPKEPLKGGTWICATKHRILVLLNGAFEKHERSETYIKSRGVLLLELAEYSDPIQHLKFLELKAIEPFTLVLIEQNKVEEFRWTGMEYYTEIKDANKAYIWSSATLYTRDARRKREELFNEFLESNELSIDSQWNFHTTPSSDLENGIVIKRTIGPQTVSTTQLIIGDSLEQFHYFDHIQDQLKKL